MGELCHKAFEGHHLGSQRLAKDPLFPSTVCQKEHFRLKMETTLIWVTTPFASLSLIPQPIPFFCLNISDKWRRRATNQAQAASWLPLVACCMQAYSSSSHLLPKNMEVGHERCGGT